MNGHGVVRPNGSAGSAEVFKASMVSISSSRINVRRTKKRLVTALGSIMPALGSTLYTHQVECKRGASLGIGSPAFLLSDLPAPVITEPLAIESLSGEAVHL